MKHIYLIVAIVCGIANLLLYAQNIMFAQSIMISMWPIQELTGRGGFSVFFFFVVLIAAVGGACLALALSSYLRSDNSLDGLDL